MTGLIQAPCATWTSWNRQMAANESDFLQICFNVHSRWCFPEFLLETDCSLKKKKKKRVGMHARRALKGQWIQNLPNIRNQLGSASYLELDKQAGRSRTWAEVSAQGWDGIWDSRGLSGAQAPCLSDVAISRPKLANSQPPAVPVTTRALTGEQSHNGDPG